MTQRPYQQTDLRWIYAIGIPPLIAFAFALCSTFYVIGYYLYTTYAEPKAEAISVKQSRVELESKYRELLAKAGYRNDVKVGSISDELLTKTNRKLELSIRSGIKASQ